MLTPVERILIHTDEVSETPDAEHRNVVKLNQLRERRARRQTKHQRLDAAGLILRSKTTYVWDGESFSERPADDPAKHP